MILTYGGGPPVIQAYKSFGAADCVPIYNAVDPATHHPVAPNAKFEADLALLANRLPDREARIGEFFFRAASILPTAKFILGGSGWNNPLPPNVTYVGHVYTADHNAFNCSPRAVLNVSRDSMASYGYSPATRVFEAAGAGACLITDYWEGIDEFLEPDQEVLVARNGDEVAEHVRCLTRPRMSIVVLGLSITSSWGNGHATTYRGLVRELARRGHALLFLERDMPWYAANRDLPRPPYGRTELYSSLDDLRARFTRQITHADLVIVGSYVPQGVEVGKWVIENARGLCAFYDIDTPVTLAKLARGDYEYISPELISKYDLYLSFTGGPTLEVLERHRMPETKRRAIAERARAKVLSAHTAAHRAAELEGYVLELAASK